MPKNNIVSRSVWGGAITHSADPSSNNNSNHNYEAELGKEVGLFLKNGRYIQGLLYEVAAKFLVIDTETKHEMRSWEVLNVEEVEKYKVVFDTDLQPSSTNSNNKNKSAKGFTNQMSGDETRAATLKRKMIVPTVDAEESVISAEMAIGSQHAFILNSDSSRARGLPYKAFKIADHLKKTTQSPVVWDGTSIILENYSGLRVKQPWDQHSLEYPPDLSEDDMKSIEYIRSQLEKFLNRELGGAGSQRTTAPTTVLTGRSSFYT